MRPQDPAYRQCLGFLSQGKLEEFLANRPLDRMTARQRAVLRKSKRVRLELANNRKGSER